MFMEFQMINSWEYELRQLDFENIPHQEFLHVTQKSKSILLNQVIFESGQQVIK